MTDRVLVIGGAGFLGGQLTRHLISAGRRVRVLDLRIPAHPMLVADASLLELREGSIFNVRDIESALDDVDVVFHIIKREIPRPFTVHDEDGYIGPSHAVLDVRKLVRLTGWSPQYDLPRGVLEAWRRLEADATPCPSQPSLR